MPTIQDRNSYGYTQDFGFAYTSLRRTNLVLHHNFTKGWVQVHSDIVKRVRKAGAMTFSPRVDVAHWFCDMSTQMTTQMFKFQTQKNGDQSM